MKPEISIIVPVYNVEKYIRNMLESVRKQTFRDFEVIIVNDGSTDGSQAIIDEYTFIDDKFKSFIKENGGVASARNMGISLAEGRFLVFYDPDDYIPHDALEKMHKVASMKDSDMVIGVMEELNLGEHLIYMHSQKLAKQKVISPLDTHFFGAWSLCHKMFSTDFVKVNGLKIEELKNAEDGVFTFCALNCAKRINGCNSIAYNYIKRPFWLSPSATQNISREYLDGLLASHDRILEEAERLGRSHLNQEECELYLQKLYIRFIEGEMINGYYRGIWRAEDDLIPVITERTEEYRKHITRDQWNGIVRRHKDLNLNKGYMTKEELASSPLVSVVIGQDLEVDKLNLVLGSLYNQNFPRFEVLVSESSRDEIDPVYRKMANIHFVSDEGNYGRKAIAQCRADSVMYIEEFVIFSKFTMRQLYNRLHRDEELDFVTMLVKHFDGDNFEPLRSMSAAYGYTFLSNRPRRLTYMDPFISNKMFRKSSIEGLSLGSDLRDDIRRMYSVMKYSKLRKGFMLTDMTDDDIGIMSGENYLNPLVGINYIKNETLDGMIKGMKRVITREDIDRIKSFIKR